MALPNLFGILPTTAVPAPGILDAAQPPDDQQVDGESTPDTSATSFIRPPAVAGSFYPADPTELSGVVEALLAQAIGRLAHEKTLPTTPPKAVIAPHAGYVYSGATAALAYARLLPAADRVRKVVVAGPTHRVDLRGIGLSEAEAFATPLGVVPVSRQDNARLATLEQCVYFEPAHSLEHSLEVHLPFLQTIFTDFELLPLAVSDATAAEVSQVLEMVWGGEETVVVVSSDLSHYLDYFTAKKTDATTIEQIKRLEPEIDSSQACGARPVNGLLAYAAQHDLRPHLLDWCNSGDSVGDKTRVVGYLSLELQPPSAPQNLEFNDDSARILTGIARQAIGQVLGIKTPFQMPDELQAPYLDQPGACFVTLTLGESLRGCIGSLTAYRDLLTDLRANARAAAVRDPRFDPLSPEELAACRIEVSVLSSPEPLAFNDRAEALAKLRPGVDGVIFSSAQHRATYLPQVWQQIPQREEFLASLMMKAGLAPDYWDENITLERYTVEAFHEPPGSVR